VQRAKTPEKRAAIFLQKSGKEASVFDKIDDGFPKSEKL